jgi:hypothetical protein
MESKKVPNYHSDLKISKSPKTSENPAQYKDMPIAWQLSFIDDESKWGTKCLRENISFGKYEELLTNLTGEVHNDLLEAIDVFHNKRFDHVTELLNAVKQKSNDHISIDQQQILLNHLNENPFWTEIYTKIRHFETNTWHIIEREQHGGRRRKTKHHNVSVSDIIPEARKRLEKLNYDDIDELFSIRFDGELRIWGIRTFSYLKVLWIDFNHEICPSLRN